MSEWIVERRRDTAARLHERSADLVAPAPRAEVEVEIPRRISVLEATAPAVVLGRGEPEDHVTHSRAAAAGVEVVRRRSGGGAVLVGPGRTVWVDVVIPVGDPLWSPDVGRAMWWLGDAWAAALDEVGLRGAAVWRGPQRRTEWSDRVCFAGLGSGEVTVPGADGASMKVVGVAQRRTLRGALFQCAALVHWDPEELLGVLALSDEDRRSASAALAGVATGVGDRADALVDAVIRRMMTAGGVGRTGELS